MADFMDKKIQLHEECPDFGYIWDFEAGRRDENRPICYNHEMKSLHPDKIVHLCAYGRAVELHDIGGCAACAFFPEQHKQGARFS
jgi:hypothetical protein